MKDPPTWRTHLFRLIRVNAREAALYAVALLLGLAVGLSATWLLVSQFELSVVSTWLGDRLVTFTTVFLGIFIEAVPFLLLGTLASGLVEVFIKKKWLEQRLPSNRFLGALLGGSMGMVFPVCECGTVPLTRRLLSKGLPISIGIAFLLAAPVVNPIVIASTLAAFGFGPMLLGRVLLSLLIAVMVGLIFAVEKQSERLLLPLSKDHRQVGLVSHPSECEPAPRTRKIQQAMLIAGNEFFEMGRYLVLGAILASLMQAFLPQTTLLEISRGPISSVLVMIGLAVILSICSTVDSFVALAFVGTFTPGSILAFLVFGAMVDIKSIFMFAGVFRRRTVLYLILLPFFMTLVVAVSINLFAPWY